MAAATGTVNVAPAAEPAGERLRRPRPAGLVGGAGGTRIDGPEAALALVADELGAAEVELRALVASDVAEVPAIAGYLLDAGGKRLRPALTALGARAVGYDGPIVRLMCVGELLHLGSLLHDDVVDDGQTRRGRQAAHRVFGAPAAVLTGDYCLARAMWLAAEEGGFHAVSSLGRTVTEMAEGEVLQLKRAGDLSTSLATYLDVIDRKSAALISWCAAAGAWASSDVVAAKALERFGRGVGKAFQITDDVLDYAPDTGKTPGADLRERKVTLPLIFAMEELPGLRQALRSGVPEPDDVERWIASVRSSSALERSLDVAQGFASDAMAALDELPSGIGREALRELGAYLVERTR